MSSDAQTDTPRQPQPFWARALLGLALITAAGGGWLQYDASTRVREIPATVVAPSGDAPAGIEAGQLVDGAKEAGERAPQLSAVKQEIAERSPVGEFLTNIGISFLVAYLAGALVRSVIRKASWLIKLAVGGAIALSVAGVISIDWSDVREHGESAVERVSEESTRVRDLVTSLLPSTMVGSVGFLVGLARR